MTLPSAAVQHGPSGLFAYVVKADSTVEMRPVKTGEDSEGLVVVNEGLSPGERVVTSNQYRLQPGVRVRLLTAEQPSNNSGGSPEVAKRAAP
jgi:multidrug efflux system membrane fusion protein